MRLLKKLRKWWSGNTAERFQALPGAEDFLLVTWDSCRYDTWLRARTPCMDAHGKPRKAWAMATYTLPAHMSMFQGFLPHVATAEPLYNRFRQQIWRISHRNLATPPLVTFEKGTPSIPAGFRSRGYYTAGTAAMDWFRDAPILQHGFEHFEVPGTMAANQNDWLLDLAKKESKGRPLCLFVNYGETHSPFRHAGMKAAENGVDERFKRRRLYNQAGVFVDDWQFDEESFLRQVECAEYLDARTGELIDFFQKRGRPTTVILCGDHGECFGENGQWGHALYHEKVMEVPMLIFRLNAPPHPGLLAA